MKTIRWGIIGCGDVTEVKSGPGFQRAEHSELIAVMRRNGALAEDYARRHHVPRWHDDANAIIFAPDIDAVYVATRPDSHADYVRRCAQAGKPVYVEKPMATSFSQCQDMIDICREHAVPLFVAYYRRAMPYLLKVKALLDEGAIGAPRAVSVRQFERLPPAGQPAVPWRLDPAFGTGGKFFETACHALDALDFLFGPLQIIGGRGFNLSRTFAAEDTVTASFLCGGAVAGSGIWCFSAGYEFEAIEVTGSAGRLTLHPFSFAPIHLTRDGSHTEFAIASPPHVQQPLIQTIVNQLNGVGQCPSVGETAARTAWATEAILSQSAA